MPHGKLAGPVAASSERVERRRIEFGVGIGEHRQVATRPGPDESFVDAMVEVGVLRGERSDVSQAIGSKFGQRLGSFRNHLLDFTAAARGCPNGEDE